MAVTGLLEALVLCKIPQAVRHLTRYTEMPILGLKHLKLPCRMQTTLLKPLKTHTLDRASQKDEEATSWLRSSLNTSMTIYCSFVQDLGGLITATASFELAEYISL